MGKSLKQCYANIFKGYSDKNVVFFMEVRLKIANWEDKNQKIEILWNYRGCKLKL